MPVEQSVPKAALIEGYRRALQRFSEIAYDERADPVETYIPLFEALNWAASIADRLKKEHNPKPRLLRAIEYARNAVHHDWVDALVAGPRRFGDGTFGEGTFGGLVWRWQPSAKLPTTKPDADRQPLYDELLDGRSALDTLRALDALLASHDG